MAYNTESQGALLAKRLTARQALPRNLTVTPPRNLHEVRHASAPSNDAGLKFEKLEVNPAPPVIYPTPDYSDLPAPTLTMTIQMNEELNYDLIIILSTMLSDGFEVLSPAPLAVDAGSTADAIAALIAGSYTPGIPDGGGNVTVSATALGNVITFTTTGTNIDTAPLMSVQVDTFLAEQSASVDNSRPWDGFTTHAQYDQYIQDNDLTAPNGWDTTFKLVTKSQWLEENAIPN